MVIIVEQVIEEKNNNRKESRHKVSSDLKFAIIIFIVFAVGFIPSLLLSKESNNYDITLHDLNPYNVKKVGRKIAHFIPDDDVVVIPIETTVLLIDNVMKPDDSGILERVQRNMEEWDKREQFLVDWHLQSTEISEIPDLDRESIDTSAIPDIDEKRKYIAKMMVKYADKRISGEIKKAPDGSSLAKVRSVQKVVRPNMKIRFNKNFRIRLKIRILQGKNYIILENPYVKVKTLVRFNGNVYSEITKEFKDISLNSSIKFNAVNGSYKMSLNKRMTKNVNAIISSEQDDKYLPGSSSADNIIKFTYNNSF